VVFVAPSKPLVAQQIDACHQTCGIPGSDAVELTGEVPAKKRIEAVSLGTLILYMDFTFPCTVGGEKSVLYDTANFDE
jgi:ERCC4-related helicase